MGSFMAAANDLEKSKEFAAHLAVTEHVSSNQTVGIGSGSTVIYAVEKIAELYHSNKINDIICVPTGFQSENLIISHKLPLGSLKQNWMIDVDIDGADEVDAHLNCIKGGGGCHLGEKMVAYNAEKFIVIADYRKQSDKLCTNWNKGVPLSFTADSIGYLQKWIPQKLRQNIKSLADRANIECRLRMAQNKAGPVVTDYGNMIYDIDFDGHLECEDVATIDNVLQCIPGVVETGLFVNMAEAAYFGQNDGSVIKQTRNGYTTIKPNAKGSDGKD